MSLLPTSTGAQSHGPRTWQLAGALLLSALAGALVATVADLPGRSGGGLDVQEATQQQFARSTSMMARISGEVAGIREQMVALQRLPSVAPAAPASTAAPAAAPASPAPACNPEVGRTPLRITHDLAARNVSFEGHELTVLASTQDEYVGGAILGTGRPFMGSTLAAMLKHIKPGSTVIDAGCNFGSYAIFFAARTGPNGTLHCFEPQRKMAQLANANAFANRLTTIMEVHNLALSFAPGSIEMSAKVPDGRAAGQSIADVEAKEGSVNYGGMNLGKGGESVEAIMLDSLKITNVSFIKVDVQGAEQLMLYGAQETIRNSLPTVMYEASPTFSVTKDMIEVMRVPPEVLAFNISAFFAGLGYNASRVDEDILQTPPPRAGAAIAG